MTTTKIFESVASASGGDQTIYSAEIKAPQATNIYIGLRRKDDSTTYAALVTLWATSRDDASETTDSGWTEMVSVHGFDGLPLGDPTAGDGSGAGEGISDAIDVSEAGAEKYRIKIVQSAGSAVWNGEATVKTFAKGLS